MEENTGKNNNSNSDIEESIKNEDYLLGFNSEYKTELYNEEELENKIEELNDEQKESNQKKYTDSTAISVSQEHNNLPEINFKRKRDLSRDDIYDYKNAFFDYYDNKRKMSSPLCEYLNGTDSYLSHIFKSTVDIKYSQNFVKKAQFFGSEKQLNNLKKNFNKKNINKKNDNLENVQFKKNGSMNFSFNNIINNPVMNNNNNINKINNFNNNYINNNLYFLNNNYPTQQIFNINYINLNNFPNNNNIINRRKLTYNVEAGFIGNYFNNILNLNNQQNPQDSNFCQLQNHHKLNPLFFSYNESQGKDTTSGANNKNNSKKNKNNSKVPKKPLDKRKGDWQCPNCNNLNFAFRVACNRCQLQKPKNLEGNNE